MAQLFWSLNYINILSIYTQPLKSEPMGTATKTSEIKNFEYKNKGN